MNVDYELLEQELEEGAFKQRLETELIIGFRDLHMSGERLPPASHYASQIAEIVNRGAEEPLRPEVAFQLYQEILAACEQARETVLGQKPS